MHQARNFYLILQTHFHTKQSWKARQKITFSSCTFVGKLIWIHETKQNKIKKIWPIVSCYKCTGAEWLQTKFSYVKKKMHLLFLLYKFFFIINSKSVFFFSVLQIQLHCYNTIATDNYNKRQIALISNQHTILQYKYMIYDRVHICTYCNHLIENPYMAVWVVQNIANCCHQRKSNVLMDDHN